MTRFWISVGRIITHLRIISALAVALTSASAAHAVDVRVDITSNAPIGGAAITPVWVGFHDGSFDSYNGGLSSQEGLERIAEDGDFSTLSADFLGGYTYIDTSGGPAVSARVLSSQPGAERVDGAIGSMTGPPPIEPGETVSDTFTIQTNGANRYFSYASMVLPSSDFYVANGNPLAWDLSSLYDGEGSISFNIGLPGTVNDAGTEVNDFATSAANGLFGLPGGQAGPNTGADENGVNTTVVGDPFAAYLNPPAADLSLLDFNNAANYANGIATITITAVPEPATLGLSLVGAVALSVLAFKRRALR